MHIRKTILFIFFSLLFYNSTFSQELSSDEKNILMLQDTRSLGQNKELLNYLKSPDDKIILRALYALANISDSTTVDEIEKVFLKHPKTEVRKIAAFALGQINCLKSIDILKSSKKTEEEPAVVKFIFDALGKIGNSESLELILGTHLNEEEVNESLSLSVARFAIRGIKSENAVNKLKKLVSNNPSQKLEEKIAYAFFRIRSKDLLNPVHTEILNLTNSKSEYSKMWAFSALGYISNSDDINYVTDKYSLESNAMVRINILNSLPNYKKAGEFILNQNLIDCLFSSFNDSNPNVRITGLKIAGILFSNLKSENQYTNDIINKLGGYFKTDIAVDVNDVGEAINSYGMILKDSAKDILLQKYSETKNYELKPFIIRAFKYLDNAFIWRELTDSIGADVRRYDTIHKPKNDEMIQSKELADIYTAYVEVLSELYNKADDTTKGTLRILISAFTDSKDPVLIDDCFRFLNSDTLHPESNNFLKEILIIDYSQLSYPKDKEAILLFINEFADLKLRSAVNILKQNLASPDYDIGKASASALKKITGKEYSYKTKMHTDFDWRFLSGLSQKYAVIKTEYGDIKIKFFSDAAPFTVQNFIKLAKEKFYDGTLFHRVVPNFVIQGGDPLNNGWGGCGYSIRSEFFPLHFERGMVGMASDGKDTEGSQFFIMHSPHYHLDGKYTLFGEVVEGIDVVDKIQVGDKILNILIY
jgi:cyclophilin family peptidyl-prolyl cis-trans isomerase/HEAT repeat protein